MAFHMLLSVLLEFLLLATFSVARPASQIAPEPQILCSPLQLVFLVGATERKKPGNVGGPLTKDLNASLPGVTTYSVPYDNRFRFKTSVTKGAEMTVKYIVEQSARCPDQLFAIGGYSKGGMVVHSMNLSKGFRGRVIAIVTFGDPFHNLTTKWPINYPVVNLNPRSGFDMSQNVLSFCNKGDMLCQHSGINFIPHWTYGKDGSTKIAAEFITERMKLKQSITKM